MADQQLTPPQQEAASAETHSEPDARGHGDHGHAPDALGPIDRASWGAGILGVVLGLVVVVAIALASGAVG